MVERAAMSGGRRGEGGEVRGDCYGICWWLCDMEGGRSEAAFIEEELVLLELVWCRLGGIVTGTP